MVLESPGDPLQTFLWDSRVWRTRKETFASTCRASNTGGSRLFVHDSTQYRIVQSNDRDVPSDQTLQLLATKSKTNQTRGRVTNFTRSSLSMTKPLPKILRPDIHPKLRKTFSGHFFCNNVVSECSLRAVDSNHRYRIVLSGR